MKKHSYILLIISILSIVALWFTRTEYLESLSAFDNAKNAIFYRIMHISIICFMMINGEENKDNYIIGFGMAGILIFDMYNYLIIHNTVTVMTILFTCYSFIRNSKGLLRSVFIWLTVAAISVFFIGYFDAGIHFLFAESVVLVCMLYGILLISKTIKIWKI